MIGPDIVNYVNKCTDCSFRHSNNRKNNVASIAIINCPVKVL